MATIDVKDAANATQTLERPLPPGQALMAASRPVVIASNQSAVPISGTVTINAIPAGTANIGDVDIASMPAITIAASQSVGISGAIPAGTNNIGDVDIVTLPSLPTGANVIGSVTLSANNNLVRLNDRDGSGLTSMTRGAQQALSVQLVDASGTQITSFGGGITYFEDTLLPADPQAGVMLGRRRDTLTASEVSGDGDAIVLNANSKGQLHTIAEIPASQLSPVGPLAKSASASVTMATDEQVAHDAADSGSPWKVGGQARTTNPSAVSDADRTNFIADKLGKQVVVTAIRERKGVVYSPIAGTSQATIIPAGASGVFRDLYGLTITNTNTATVGVTIRDDSGTNVVFSWQVPAGDTRGMTLDCGSAIPQSVAATAWSATASAVSGGQIHVTALYVENT